MDHDNDTGRIGATGCLILLALAAAFWAGIYGIVSLIWSHGATGCLILLALAATFWGAVYYIISLIWSHL